MINCAIVDDEQFSVDALQKYISLFPRLNLRSVYLDPVLALQELSAHPAMDVIFLDVDMPNLNGLDLAVSLRRLTRRLIFTTAHSRYAFEAFEAEGDAFLLKPFSFAKFSSTINRLFPLEQRSQTPSAKLDASQFLVKNKDENLRMVNVDYRDVVAFESSQNYVQIHLTQGRIITAYLTIKDILDLVRDRQEFLQLHRAYVINIDNIDYIEKELVKMVGKLSFNVGESFRPNFNSLLKDRLVKTSRQHTKIA